MNIIKKIKNYNKVVEDYNDLEKEHIALKIKYNADEELLKDITVALQEKYNTTVGELLKPKRKPGRPKKENK